MWPYSPAKQCLNEVFTKTIRIANPIGALLTSNELLNYAMFYTVVLCAIEYCAVETGLTERYNPSFLRRAIPNVIVIFW